MQECYMDYESKGTSGQNGPDDRGAYGIRWDTTDNQYFTPDIEDIRIGYECEWVDTRGDWKAFRVECPHDIMMAFDDKLRVLYLTKEQIEAEGWECTNTINFFNKVGNDRFYFSWYPEMNRVEFGDNENEIGFAGECKDINTFRYICKLLGI